MVECLEVAVAEVRGICSVRKPALYDQYKVSCDFFREPYVDEQLKDSHPVSGTIDSAAVLNIGQRNAAINNGTADTFKGRLDNIQIYNKDLTPKQIMKKYENGTAQPL